MSRGLQKQEMHYVVWTKVVYQNIDNNDIWVRPLDEFKSKVDKNKYPEVKQEYRFEYIND